MENKIQKTLDWYFEIKDFEKSGKLYKNLGIKQFQKLVRLINSPKGLMKGKEDLKKYQAFTKGIELTHILGSAMLGGIGIYSASIPKEKFEDYLLCVGAPMLFNVLGNSYPIMLQRYNRNKTEKILKRIEKNEK